MGRTHLTPEGTARGGRVVPPGALAEPAPLCILVPGTRTPRAIPGSEQLTCSRGERGLIHPKGLQRLLPLSQELVPSVPGTCGAAGGGEGDLSVVSSCSKTRKHQRWIL